MTELEPEITLVKVPRDGLPDLTDSQRGLQRAADKLAQGTGPVAIDAERASGFRFSQRAYLIQLRRAGSGTFLIDPIEFENLKLIQEAIADADWILHAASQDLVCLAEVGLTPNHNLFDTELAGRLLGLPRVGLGTLTQSHLGISLAKEHSAADWSTRPLPDEWLAYAALDVDYLIDLWNILAQELRDQEKFDWALEEFAHVKANTKQVIRVDPWRKISGIHKIKDVRQLAIAKSLWLARLEIARKTDIASGRILNDAHIVEIAQAPDWSAALALPLINQRSVKKYLEIWENAYRVATELPTEELPPLKLKADGPPNPRNWQSRYPEAWAKLEAARTEINALAEGLLIPVENLITPESVRRIIWQNPTTVAELDELFAQNLVRKWQQVQVGPILRKVLEIS